MFSIHTASTGPSNSSHWRSGRASVAASLNALASTPSAHSWLAGSNSPYSRPGGSALGLRHRTCARESDAGRHTSQSSPAAPRDCHRPPCLQWVSRASDGGQQQAPALVLACAPGRGAPPSGPAPADLPALPPGPWRRCGALIALRRLPKGHVCRRVCSTDGANGMGGAFAPSFRVYSLVETGFGTVAQPHQHQAVTHLSRGICVGAKGR